MLNRRSLFSAAIGALCSPLLLSRKQKRVPYTLRHALVVGPGQLAICEPHGAFGFGYKVTREVIVLRQDQKCPSVGRMCLVDSKGNVLLYTSTYRC